MQLLASTFVNSTAAFKSPTRAGCQSSSASKQCRMVVCSSVSNIDGQTRRAALGAGVAALFSLMATSAKAERWDGVSAAIGSCALGDEGDACRKAILAKDKFTSYSDAQNNAAKTGSTVTGVPVAKLDQKYVDDTIKMGDLLLNYANLGLEDPSRVKVVKELKAEGQKWVSQYARGGSARTASARKFYIAIDAVEGHLATNGFAPFPRAKIEKVVGLIDESRELLKQGR